MPMKITIEYFLHKHLKMLVYSKIILVKPKLSVTVAILLQVLWASGRPHGGGAGVQAVQQVVHFSHGPPCPGHREWHHRPLRPPQGRVLHSSGRTGTHECQRGEIGVGLENDCMGRNSSEYG